MKKLKKEFINIDNSIDWIILSTYLLNPDMRLNKQDYNLVSSYIRKIIKILERNCDE